MTHYKCTNVRTCAIPFSGFYESSHDEALDSELEQMFRDDQGEPTPAYDIARDSIDWRVAYLAYAQLYCERLADETDATWQFDRLDSPRFYNYRGDEIDVFIAMDELQRMRRYILDNCESDWLKLCKDRLTLRDGFIPHFDSNPYTWGALDSWESPQLSLLVECYVMAYLAEHESDPQFFIAWEMVEDCNGDVSHCIETAIPQCAWDKINALEVE